MERKTQLELKSFLFPYRYGRNNITLPSNLPKKTHFLTQLHIMKLQDITTKKTKSKTSKRTKIVTDNTHASLNVYISDNYKGLNDCIAGIINTLPDTIKQLVVNANLKKVVIRQGCAMYVLDNAFTIKVKDVKLHKNHKQKIIIKHNKKHVLNTTI